MLNSFLLEKLIQFAGDPYGSRRIPEVGRAHFDCRRPGDQELGRLFWRTSDQHFCRPLTWDETQEFCRLARISVPW